MAERQRNMLCMTRWRQSAGKGAPESPLHIKTNSMPQPAYYEIVKVYSCERGANHLNIFNSNAKNVYFRYSYKISKMAFTRTLVACVLLSVNSFAQENKANAEKSSAENWAHTSIIALAPFQFSENGVGTSLSLEHALTYTGSVSLYIPAILTFNLKNTDNGYGYAGYHDNNGHDNMMFYLMPGIKFYPTGMGKIKYAIGASIVYGTGKMAQTYGPSSSYDNITGTYIHYPMTTGMYDRKLLGMIVNNSINFNLRSHLYAGGELGLGATLSDRVDGRNYHTVLLAQGSFKIGYTFR